MLTGGNARGTWPEGTWGLQISYLVKFSKIGLEIIIIIINTCQSQLLSLFF